MLPSIQSKLGLRILIAIGALGAIASAQPPAFEVASIKPAAPGAHGTRLQIAPGGRFMANNITVKFLMREAFGVQNFQIVGAPGWINSDAYDITAKAEGDANITMDQLKLMVQALLADRFKLALHRETKEMPVYALVVGKNGPKLQASKAEASPVEPGPAAPNPAGPGPRRNGPMMRLGRGELNAQKVSMSMLANQIAQHVDRTVIDKTGLKGDYDFKLEWTPDESQATPKDGGPEPPPPADTSGPSIFTAVQEQLGLKLESQKGPVEILIVDHIEKPSEN